MASPPPGAFYHAAEIVFLAETCLGSRLENRGWLVFRLLEASWEEGMVNSE
jgi:hypothetical protein